MPNLESDIFPEIQELISDFSGIKKSKITISSKLEHDLRIYGDDAIELILAYSKKFSVNLDNLNPGDHFSPEGDTVLPWIISLFSPSKKVIIDDLMVLDLVNGAKAGTLDKTVINSK